MKYCCDQFKYLVEVGEMRDFDGLYMRMCSDCMRHNGYPEKYCGNCGQKIKRKPGKKSTKKI
jgi:rRNA maturation endonuclease Nob1